MEKYFEEVAKTVGKDSLEYMMIKKYVTNEEQLKHFNQIVLTITVAHYKPLMDSIIYYIEDLLLQEQSKNQTLTDWEKEYEAAFKSKEGLLNLIRGDGIEYYDRYQFVQDCFTDEMVTDFMTNHFSGDLDSLGHELVEYYDEWELLAV